MYKKFLLLAIVITLLFSCKANISYLTSSKLIVTPTETIIPFSSLRLDNLLIQPNDFPEGVTGTEISYSEEKSSTIQVPADYYIQEKLEYHNNKQVEIKVWIYEEIINTQRRYSDRVDVWKNECEKPLVQCDPRDPELVPQVGEVSNFTEVYNLTGGLNSYTLVFRRCNAVIEISTVAIISKPAGIITNGEILDNRLKLYVCRQ